MSFRYRKNFNILEELKKKNINTNTIRKNKLLSERTLTKIRNGEMISLDNIDKICQLLDCQPSDIIEYKK